MATGHNQLKALLVYSSNVYRCYTLTHHSSTAVVENNRPPRRPFREYLKYNRRYPALFKRLHAVMCQVPPL
jgi:hypothetical protein